MICTNSAEYGNRVSVVVPGEWDLHTHGRYCRHGSGQVSDLVRSAKSRGLKAIGISEHAPVPGNRWSDSRMDLGEVSRYLDDFTYVDGSMPGSPQVCKAMECDYLPEYHGYYQEEFLGKLGLDYLVGAVHYVTTGQLDISLHRGTIDARVLARYTEQYIDMMQSGLFLFGAHPDVFGMVYHKWDGNASGCAHAICEAAAALSFPLEINGNGFRRPQVETVRGFQRPYPLSEFWAIASIHGVHAVVNSDAHYPRDVGSSLDLCIDFAKQHGVSICNLLVPSGSRSAGGLQFVDAFSSGKVGLSLYA